MQFILKRYTWIEITRNAEDGGDLNVMKNTHHDLIVRFCEERMVGYIYIKTNTMITATSHIIYLESISLSNTAMGIL